MKRTTLTALRPLTAGLWLLPVLFLAGCQTSGPYAPQSDKHPGVSEANATVVLMDPAVQASVTSVGDRKVTLPDGRLHAEANLKNREGRRIVVQVQCVFKDEQGFATEGDPPWVTLPLSEYATETVSFDSMNPKASKYTIRVKQVR